MDSESKELVGADEIVRAPITRRRFDRAWKQAIIKQALRPGASIAKLARDNDLNTNQLFKWCRLYESALAAGAPARRLVPVTIDAPLDADSASHQSVSLTIELARGKIKLEGAIDAEMLCAVVQMLAAR